MRVRPSCAALAVVLGLSACAPQLDTIRYASDQAPCTPAQLPSAEELAKMPTETIRMRAQRAEVEKQTFVVSGGQACPGTGTYAETWSSLLRERTQAAR